MTIVYSPRKRIEPQAQVVPGAATWDGGHPLRGAATGAVVRTLEPGRPQPRPTRSPRNRRREASVNYVLGGLFGLTLTLGLLIAAPDMQEPLPAPPLATVSVQ